MKNSTNHNRFCWLITKQSKATCKTFQKFNFVFNFHLFVFHVLEIIFPINAIYFSYKFNHSAWHQLQLQIINRLQFEILLKADKNDRHWKNSAEKICGTKSIFKDSFDCLENFRLRFDWWAAPQGASLPSRCVFQRFICHFQLHAGINHLNLLWSITILIFSIKKVHRFVWKLSRHQRNHQKCLDDFAVCHNDFPDD